MTSLIRNPVVLGVVMMLVFWQSSKYWSKGGDAEGGGFAGRKALNGGGMEDFDMDAFMKMQGRGGGGLKKGGEFEEAFQSTFGKGMKGRDFSRDPDVMRMTGSSRVEEVE